MELLNVDELFFLSAILVRKYRRCVNGRVCQTETGENSLQAVVYDGSRHASGRSARSDTHPLASRVDGG